jgi:hypothetical protein
MLPYFLPVRTHASPPEKPLRFAKTRSDGELPNPVDLANKAVGLDWQ